ncbi:MAG: selenocysteine-specific translation elongation factor [Candidatus Velthaea sp.]
MHIIGTAGHVDHGKSSLVRALTGTNPDRWIEEQLRGMTLDLGFAHLRFPDGVEAGIVDVPGHERFLHNMLAGAAGMELLLLIVAANEGPKTQTIEHLAILNYLHVRRTIVVLTKSDLVDAEERSYAEAAVRDAVRGTIAEGAPAIAVSTLTGAGLDELYASVRDSLAASPPHTPQAPAFLPIDRVFALSGHGTIVTGTLMQGRIAPGDQLTLQPSGANVRVRSVQVFGEKKAADGGMRVAANLPGIDVADIARGEVLAAPEFRPQSRYAVRFTPLPAALPMLRRRTAVRAYLGSAEILGTLVFEAVPTSTSTIAATLNLRQPAITFPGEAYVVRRLSPKDLLGGGVLDAGAAGAPEEHDSAESPDVSALMRALREGGLQPKNAAQLGAAANVREDRASDVLEEAAAAGRARRVLKPPGYIDAAAADALLARVTAFLDARQAAQSWSLGGTSLALARELNVEEPLLVRILASFVEDARIAYRAGYYATLGFTPALSSDQRAFFEQCLPIDPAQPYIPAPLETLVTEVRRTKIAGASQAMDTLVATGALVKVGDSVYRGTQIADIRGKLEAALRRDKQITMAGFRDLTGTTRKYAVPLLEWFDATGVTLRNGDIRVLRVTVKR